jgi:hypothetical protein
MAKEIKIKVPEIDEVFPEEVRNHIFQSYKELLMAFKKAIDYQIEKIDELQERMKTEKKELKRISVE